MTNAFASMGYPHWLIVVGAVFFVLGLIGLAIRPKRDPGDDVKEMASVEQGRSELEAEPAQAEAGNRKTKLAEQKRDRWAKKDRDTKEN